MKKTTLQYIKNHIGTDITAADSDFLYSICNHVEKLCYSVGVYGCNGVLVQDRYSGEYYKVTSRSSALFILI